MFLIASLPHDSCNHLQHLGGVDTGHELTSCSSLLASNAACCSLPPMQDMRNPLLLSGNPAVLVEAKYLRFLFAPDREAPSCWLGRFRHWPLPSCDMPGSDGASHGNFEERVGIAGRSAGAARWNCQTLSARRQPFEEMV